MQAQIEGRQEGEPDPEVAKLIAAAENQKVEWNLNSKKGLQDAVAFLTELLKNHGGKTIDLPDDPQGAKMKVGEVVTRNRDKTAAELITLFVKEFGFKEDKEAKAAKKEAEMEKMVQCVANTPLVAAFQELAELYFKAGNRNAGVSYTKATNAIKDLDFEVTAENAMSLSKGKTKVRNIGKSSAEKMKEFCETGTMTKLEEKRADAA